MQSRTLRVLNWINWLGLSFMIVVLLSLGALYARILSEGLAVFVGFGFALTLLFWGPALAIIALVSIVLEIRALRLESRNWKMLLRAPSPYVLLGSLFLLSFIFG